MDNHQGTIKNLLIEDEIKESYLRYAMSVIVSRALPDARDGLKPSQRRILVAMNDLNLGPRGKYRKCAKIAGDTSGNYHPHGESVIYPTLVRMAQTFNCRYQLVDGQGNFGSIDGDPPAAMRYTEARMTRYSTEMLDDIEYETVDYIPNYDETRTEPVVFPSRFPNCLCNGSSGIAVGMATNIPPHNVKEVCKAVIELIENPDITVAELMEHIKGPDFPTGGQICGRKGLLEAYSSGRGRITLRSKIKFENLKGGKVNIVVTEIPYQISKTSIIDRIVKCVKEERLKGIADVRDESDKDGMRLVIELKKGEDENVIVNQLFKETSLQVTYSIIMIALVNNRPITLSLKQMLEVFRDHRVEVIRRRTKFLLNKAEARLHIVEGLKIAVLNIDKIIEMIKKSESVDAAQKALMKTFNFSEIQAKAILEMRLQRLTALEREKLEAEYQKLVEEIRELKLILSDENLIFDIIKEDMYEIADKYEDSRRTHIVAEARDLDIEDLIAEEDVVVTISNSGYVKRLPIETYRRQKRGGKGVTGMDMKEDDFIEHLFIASTHDYILFFTDDGKVHWLKVYDVPQMGRTSRGRAIVNLLELPEGVSIASQMPVRDFDKRQLVMVTRNGIVKKTELAKYGRPQKGGIIGINIDEGDQLVGVVTTHGKDDIIIATKQGYAVRFGENDLRSQGRATRGVKGVRLQKDDHVVAVLKPSETTTFLTIAEKGFGKRTEFDAYNKIKRGGKGVINLKVTEKTGPVVGCMAVTEDDEIMLMSAKGMVVRTKVSYVSVIGRSTQGVKLITLKESDKLVALARIQSDEEDEDVTESEGAADVSALDKAPESTESESKSEADSEEQPDGE